MSKGLVKRLRAFAEFGNGTDGSMLAYEAADAIEKLELDNKDQAYQIEKLIYRRDHPGEL